MAGKIYGILGPVIYMKDLQNRLKDKNITYYIIPTDDDHLSEEVGDWYRLREFFSGFTGSAGTLLAGQDEAYLWTDGRYFIQAARQLKDGITLMKMNMPGVPDIMTFLTGHLKDGDTLAFDYTTMRASFVMDLEDELDADVTFRNLTVGDLWTNRPAKRHDPAWLYDIAYHGESTKSKLQRVRQYMEDNDCDHHVIGALDDIAWIFNLRGNDIDYSPVVCAFAIINKDDACLYIDPASVSDEIRDHFTSLGVSVKDEELIYEDVRALRGSVLIDPDNVNYALLEAVSGDLAFGVNPSQAFKAVKNDVEMTNARLAHVKDGVAVTKFMHWLKHTDVEGETEITVADKLEDFRKEQEHYLEPSFSTICAYGDNGAIIHYHAEPDACADLHEGHLLMIDSGGQYYEGTTDITRTFALGDVTADEKRAFTLVLKGFLNLMDARFTKGCTGVNLDTMAREALWREGFDFRHGTGHGVGHLLNCHEGPQNISTAPRGSNAPLEPGMITSDEPGLYVENHYGVRHENLLLCVPFADNDFGTFYAFEPLTMVPIDIDGIDMTLMSAEDLTRLNAYHKTVCDTLLPYMNEEEAAWLKHITRPLGENA